MRAGSMPTRGTLWASDGRTGYIVDIHRADISEEADLAEFRRRLIIEGEYTATRHADPAKAQDALDGAALRRLREALPEGSHWMLDEDLDGFMVQAGPTPWSGAEERWVKGSGSTIAEAADSARERMVGG